MKQSTFFLFIIAVLILYALVNTYLFFKGYQALPESHPVKTGYIVVFLLLALPFVVSRILVLADSPVQFRLFSESGGIWLAAVLYFLIFALAFDLLGLANRFLHFLPDLRDYRLIIFAAVVVMVSGIVTYGYFNAKSPAIKRLNIRIDKKSDAKNLKIALVSDIHFGTILNEKEIRKMFSLIGNENPDILLLAGDLVDEGATPERIARIKPLFDSFQPRYGKIAILGNHEYLNKIDRSVGVFDQLGIRLLRDTVVTINGKFILAGREDLTFEKVNRAKRKSIRELLQNSDTSLPVILLDHQPANLGSENPHRQPA